MLLLINKEFEKIFHVVPSKVLIIPVDHHWDLHNFVSVFKLYLPFEEHCRSLPELFLICAHPEYIQFRLSIQWQENPK